MKRNHQFLFFTAVSILILVFSSFNKGGKKKFKGYTKEANGSYFLLIKKGTGTTVADTGGAVFIKIKFKTPADSVFIDINEAAHSPSYPMRVDKPAFKGDFLDLFLGLHVGDSASFFVSLDSLHKYYPKEFVFEPKFDTMKYLGFAVKLDSIYTRSKIEELRKKSEEDAIKQQAEMKRIGLVMQPIQDSARAREPMLKEKDFELLAEYIKTKWDGPKNPGPDGIFFKETLAGTGQPIKTGAVVSVRYTGKYLDGTIFDSNMLVAGQEPLAFRFGVDPMIKGFEIGVSKMTLNSKATFIVPSQLGYEDGLTRIFDVEIVSVK